MTIGEISEILTEGKYFFATQGFFFMFYIQNTSNVFTKFVKITYMCNFIVTKYVYNFKF